MFSPSYKRLSRLPLVYPQRMYFHTSVIFSSVSSDSCLPLFPLTANYTKAYKLALRLKYHIGLYTVGTLKYPSRLLISGVIDLTLG
jgi:hypothetical protein